MSAITYPKVPLWVPKFEPWRILRPLFSGGFQPMGAGVTGTNQSSLSSIEDGNAGQQPPAAGGVAFSYAFREMVSSSSDLSTYTFSSADIGSTTDPHHVAVSVGAKKSSSGTATVTSITVDGQSCSARVSRTSSQSISTVWITDAEITSTTGDVVVSGNGKTRLGAAMYEIYGLDSTTAIDTGTAGGTSLSDTLTCTDDSVVIGTSFIGSGNASNWTATSGVTEEYDADIDSGRRFAGGSDLATGASVSVAFGFNSNSQSTHAAVTLGN